MAGTDGLVWAGALRVIAAVTRNRSPTTVAPGPTVAVAFRAAPGMIGARLSICRGREWGDVTGVAEVEALGDVLLSWERWPSG